MVKNRKWHLPNDTPLQNFGRNLRYLREFHGMTQQALAEKVETSRSYVSDMERCNGISPSIATLQRFALVFAVETWKLLLPERDFIRNVS